MNQQLAAGALLLAAASLTTAQQYGPSDGSEGGNPYSSSNNLYTSGNGDSGALSSYNTMIVAHAALATLAFGLIFPAGGILIRVASFPRLWLLHGLLQLLAYILYFAAIACGAYMASHAHMLNDAHPMLGFFVFALVLFQPLVGFMHHVAFKKYSRRTVWSYAHIWLGRVAITLGIINGGMGLQLSQKTRLFAPSQGAAIGYWVVAGVMWMLYVASVIWGERRRWRQRPKYEAARGSSSEGGQPLAQYP